MCFAALRAAIEPMLATFPSSDVNQGYKRDAQATVHNLLRDRIPFASSLIGTRARSADVRKGRNDMSRCGPQLYPVGTAGFEPATP